MVFFSRRRSKLWGAATTASTILLLGGSSSKLFLVSAQSTSQPELEVISYECNVNLKKINTRERKEGSSIRICFELGDKSKQEGNLELLEIDNWMFKTIDPSSSDVKQRVIESGDSLDTDVTKVSCFPGKEICSLESELRDELFLFDGVVQGVGQVSIQFTTGRYVGMTYTRLDFPVSGTEDQVDKVKDESGGWFSRQEAVIQFLIIFGVAVLVTIGICVFGACCFWNRCCADRVILGRRLKRDDRFFYYEEEVIATPDDNESKDLESQDPTGMIIMGPDNVSETQFGEDEDSAEEGKDDGDSTLHTRDQTRIFPDEDQDDMEQSERINRTINGVLSKRASSQHLSSGTSNRNLEKAIEDIVSSRTGRTTDTFDSKMPPGRVLEPSMSRTGRTNDTFDSNMPPGKVLYNN